ncbi:VWA domain-containing protein [Halomonas daqiaonensis]|uniref:Ca-activated chloride channel family protein n=1 Tax=Halomonas daqiaonensis TaxID=650850 RepID=A0A1H7QXC4_9GAMM|nr:VWA domain-containing protein [Halomonas daqiaonensis]SEL52368.1 Ca-activated chloride channel family protein [Halomonas daqiaonensis]
MFSILKPSTARPGTQGREQVFGALPLAAALTAGLLIGGAATAQEAGPGSIIVLDASGSMWGQIAGEPKITIAQRVVGDLLDTLPTDQTLGLVAYGHRRKGDCGDIETLVEPATGSAEAIRAAVEAMSPKGKTPLSAAVLKAAERLKYEEEIATVVLISDGEETCNLDPCEVGRRLEETGVGFTAHVVGFGVTEETGAGLACLAENTGGLYLAADDAEGLAAALERVSAPPDPVPATFTAEIAGTGEPITEGLVWTLRDLGTDAALVENAIQAELRHELAPGRYEAEALWIDAEAYASVTVEIEPGGEPIQALVSFERPLPQASVDAPESAPAGATVEVAWTGPDAEKDYLAVFPEEGNYTAYTYTSEGSSLQLLMPPEPGRYEIRYVLSASGAALAAAAIEIAPVTASVTPPESAVVGETAAVAWTGPGYDGDYIAVAELGMEDRRYLTYAYVESGSPIEIQIPGEPGEYELRYIQRQGAKVMARAPLIVRGAEATLAAPETATAGTAVAVEWTGPARPGDFLTVALPGAKGGDYENYVYTRNGSPASLVMPANPGDYEIRYVLDQDRAVLATRPIRVETAQAGVNAPATVVAGSTVEISWTGPDSDKDYLSVATPDDAPTRYVNYVYTREGSPAPLMMPAEPGTYEIRYIQREGGRVIARQPIEVGPVEAQIAAPPSAPAGGTLQVMWRGPAYNGDYLAIARPGDDGGRYESYVYAREPGTATFTLPEAPGEYELRYVMRQGKRVIARTPLTVAAP